MALLKDGYLSQEELEELPGVPSKDRLAKGRVVVIECAQEIPCNPCEAACIKGAIRIGENITDLPVLDDEKCTGCALCISACPGQAIFVVDATYSEIEGTVTLPYEYLPLPAKSDLVNGLDRAGQIVCLARVLRVVHPEKYDHTAVITLAVPKDLVMDVRSLKLKQPEN
jgi:Fe-S-cluster-containing hydrogenase component 2